MSDAPTFVNIVDGTDAPAAGGAVMDVPSPHDGGLVARIAASAARRA